MLFGKITMSMLVVGFARCTGAAAWTPNVFARRARPLNMVRMEASSFTKSVAKSSKSDTTMLDPLVVCGPSGAGKGTLISKYMEELGGDQRFGFSVSHTTRAPRPGEVQGVHYHFVEYDDMRAQIDEGLFLEHAEVHGNLYGTSWASLRNVAEQTGKRCLLDIDVQGVKQLRLLEAPEVLEPKYLFIAPPSLEVLESRLLGRGTESAESLERRTRNARAEVEYGMQEGNFDAIVVNDDLEEAGRSFAEAIRSLYPDL